MGQFSDSTSDQVGEYYQAQAWKAEGIKEERERIIKLLEEMEKHIYYSNWVMPGGSITRASESPVSITLADAIALIKGENK